MHAAIRSCQAIPAHQSRNVTQSYQHFTAYCLLLCLLSLPITARAGLASPVFLTFFDVGQGDALLIHQHDACAVLVDAGPPGSGKEIGATIAAKKISRLDRLIISHPHQDHFGGALNLPTNLAVTEINDNGVDNTPEPNFDSYRNWRKQHLYQPLGKGDAWRCGSILFTVLGPNRGLSNPTGINDSSLVLRIDVGPISLLLPGDLENIGWQSLDANAEQLDTTILKIPHHGGEDKHLERRLARISPELSVISVGRDNRIDAPGLSTLAAITRQGSRIWRTDRQGSLAIRIDEQGWHYVRP